MSAETSGSREIMAAKTRLGREGRIERMVGRRFRSVGVAKVTDRTKGISKITDVVFGT
jgi:hypothetical protein